MPVMYSTYVLYSTPDVLSSKIFNYYRVIIMKRLLEKVDNRNFVQYNKMNE